MTETDSEAERIAARLTTRERSWFANPARIETDVWMGHDMAKRQFCTHSGWPIKLLPLGIAVAAIIRR